VKRQPHIGVTAGLVALVASCSPVAQLNLAPDPASQSTQVVRLVRGVLQGNVYPLRSLGGEFRATLRLMLQGKPDTVIAETMTDTKGAFQFQNLADGRFRLLVLSIGYRRAEYTVVTANSGARSLAIGIKVDPFNLDEICAGTCPPPPSGVITGSIMCTGQAGLVPPEMELSLTDSASRHLRAIAPVDTRGHFELSRLPLGAWRLEVYQRATVLSVLYLRLIRDTVDAVNVRLPCR